MKLTILVLSIALLFQLNAPVVESVCAGNNEIVSKTRTPPTEKITTHETTTPALPTTTSCETYANWDGPAMN
jgi:hypothetical protein